MLGSGPPANGGPRHTKAIGNGLLGHAITAPAAGTLLTAFGEPEQEHDRQEQQHGGPSQKAGSGHFSKCGGLWIGGSALSDRLPNNSRWSDGGKNCGPAIHKLKQSEQPGPQHPDRVPRPRKQCSTAGTREQRHPQLVLTDGSSYQFPHLLLGHAIRMPAVAPPCGDRCYSVGIPNPK